MGMRMSAKRILAIAAAAAMMFVTASAAMAEAAEDWCEGQLNKQGKQFYAQILKDVRAYRSTSRISYEGTAQKAVDACEPISTLLKKQHPDLFWVSYDTQTISAKDGVLTYHVPVYAKYVKNGKVDAQAIREEQARLEEVAGKIGVGKTKRESVGLFNRYLSNNCKYNYAFDDRNSYELTGTLLGGGGVCEGFAKGMKYLCDRAGIECVEVSGSGILSGKTYPAHEWCYVRMDDGKWYLVDPTWNSLTSNKEKWFLLGSEAAVDGLPLLQSHKPDGDQYPTLAQNNYGA